MCIQRGETWSVRHVLTVDLYCQIFQASFTNSARTRCQTGPWAANWDESIFKFISISLFIQERNKNILRIPLSNINVFHVRQESMCSGKGLTRFTREKGSKTSITTKRETLAVVHSYITHNIRDVHPSNKPWEGTVKRPQLGNFLRISSSQRHRMKIEAHSIAGSCKHCKRWLSEIVQKMNKSQEVPKRKKSRIFSDEPQNRSYPIWDWNHCYPKRLRHAPSSSPNALPSLAKSVRPKKRHRDGARELRRTNRISNSRRRLTDRKEGRPWSCEIQRSTSPDQQQRRANSLAPVQVELIRETCGSKKRGGKKRRSL